MGCIYPQGKKISLPTLQNYTTIKYASFEINQTESQKIHENTFITSRIITLKYFITSAF